jgi:transcriptional regulator with XRE-family HTH domain
MNDVKPEELRRVIANRVRTRRHELGLTQVQLAERLRVKQPYVAQIEDVKDDGSLGTDVLAKLAEALQTSPSALLSAEQIFAPALS